MKRFLLAILFLAQFWPLTAWAAGASLSVSPGSVSTEVNKTFTVNINITASQAINSAQGTVTYPSGLLTATGVSTSGSIFSFWTDNPSAGASIKFGGGLPNPGHVGTGKIFSITFKALKEGSGTISITGGKALANDGAGTNIFSGAAGSTVTVSQPLTDLNVSSSTHPDQNKWYTNKNAALSWNKPSDITSFDYTLTNGGITKSGSGAATTASFSDLGDGVWTFKLTGHSSKQDRSDSYKIQIDTTAPEAFSVSVKQTSDTDPFPVLSYEAKDATSGIDHYEITVEGQETKRTTETSYKLDRQVPGTHHVTVKAVDKAGNSTEAKFEFKIEGFPGPTITSYSKYVSVLQPVNLRGQALFGAKIRLYVDGKADAEFMVKENLSDKQRQQGDSSKYKDDENVEWNYFYKGTLLPGNHSFYAIQIKADTSESNPSNTVVTRVLWSSISIGGIILPFALVAIILLVLLVLTLFFLFWIWRHSRHKIGSWKERLVKLRQKVDSELHSMGDEVHRATDEFEDKPKTLRNQIEGKIEGTTKLIDQTLDSAIETAEDEEKKVQR